MLWAISSKNFEELNDLFNNNKLLSLKLQRDFRRLLEKLFTFWIGNNNFLKYLYVYDIDKVIMILLFESLAHLDVIYESKILNFIPSEILEELEHLWSENYIPDLTKLFDIILPFIHSEKGIPIVKSATDRYLLKINYFGTSDNKMEYNLIITLNNN